MLTVQVIKDPIGTKGARLSTQISIAGRMLVYLPQDKHIGISQKIEKEAEREQLRVRLQSLLPPDEKGGYIVRTMAEDASDADLKADVDYLRKTWSTITHGARTRPATSLLHQDLSLAQRVLRDFVGDETATIQVDSRENYVKLREFAEIYTPSELTRLQHYTGERPLFDLYGVEEEILRALGRRVDLKSGGYLIVDQTEAMTTIDVNTGGFVGGRNFADTIFKTNLEAAHAIARQLRLRNLGGIIILDFIDMDNAEHRNAVLAELKRTLSRDRTKVSVSNFSPLGLVEMTRKRTRESLAHIIARQLRLRNLGGIIILDFIDMDNAEHRNAVLAELKRTLSRDRTKVSVSNFSPLGLVEMTRKRTRESLAHILCEPCPACAGKGQVKTSRTICYEILRELLREAKQFNPREFRILASQEVVDLFLEEESQHLAMLGDFIGKKISLQVENAYHQEQYDVILM